MLNFLEAVPLTVFVWCIRHIDTQIPDNWKMPFWAGGLLAFMVTSFFLYKKIFLNRIFLGINIYLCTGGLGFITGQGWLNDTYGHLQASGMILWIIIVGVFSSIMSPRGFVGVDSSDKKSVRKFSIYLILLSLCAFIVSYVNQGNRLLSEIIPFLGLFAGQTILKDRTIKHKAEFLV